jgi:predicted ferric reductase
MGAIREEKKSMAAVRRRKAALIACMALTVPAPLLFLDLSEPTAVLVILKLAAKTGSLAGTVLLIWQFLLGFRGVVSGILQDLIWVLDLNKRLGRWSLLLISLHPVFIGLYYLEKYDRNVFLLELQTGFSRFVLLGILAFALLILMYATSLPLRNRIRNGAWYAYHLTAYALFPLALIHAFGIGMTIADTGLKYVWTLLSALFASFCLFRLLFSLGFFSAPYQVVRSVREANRVADILMKPGSRRLEPGIGQFVYVRRGAGARPFTVSFFESSTGELGITVKAQGALSTSLQDVRPGDVLGLDGPYGVFAWEALESGRPVAMIAGGIGITPFRRLIRLHEERGDPADTLFYAAERLDDIVFRREFDSLEKVKVVYVLNSEPDYPGERGLITLDLIRRHLRADPLSYDYLICGPPPMIRSLESELRRAGLPDGQIHHELFNF